ncbi:secreted RxLR effector protein 161-like [Vicia villosa]|uniref:secreted RxLR effector protein 161-like n=1 Tax=Vicia villosa TaxID=3911 RepID=UPI00273BA411|nr:secreted RxLR effector protein 161-like [Vicia villosa]
MNDNKFVSQIKYAKNIVDKFGLDNASHKRTSIATHLQLSKGENGEDVDQSLYRSMIGNFLYLTASRLDITFVFRVCARFQEKPKASHLTQGKRFSKYISGTYDYGILYSHNISIILVGYCDVDWDGSVVTKKVLQCGCLFVGNNMISWLSKKQNCVSLSTTKAEYIVVRRNFTQLLWMTHMLKQYNVEQDFMTLFYDIMSAIIFQIMLFNTV